MSFLDYDVEAQREALVHDSSDRESKTSLIVQKASNLLTDFANGSNTLERLISQLGTKRDNVQLRQTIEEAKIPELNEYRQQLEHLTNDISHLISSNPHSSSEEKFSEEKLRKEFESINNNFNLLKRRYNEKSNSVIINERIANRHAVLDDEGVSTSRSLESTPLLQQDEQQQQVRYTIPQQELDIHSILAEERANEIKKIHNGVEEINSIYKQLGYLVQQQGAQVDTVENNMSNLSNHAQNATQELIKADNYQKKKRKCSCIILIALIIIVLIVVLAIFA